MSNAPDPGANLAHHDGLVIQGYTLIAQLGEGGAGIVYRARQHSTGQEVALKLLRERECTARARARFERETQLCAHLHHPHIVRLLDKGETADGQLFAVFEYVPGETLKDLLVRQGALTALETGELMGQVLDALACAHEQGIAHRDLKPQNVMVSHTGSRAHVKILDFGIAAFAAERTQGTGTSLTLTQENLCSPSYCAPEQLRGEPPTIKSDLYAWGLLFIECLTGRPAIAGKTMAEIFHQQLSIVDVPLPGALAEHPVGTLLRRVLAKNPAERAGQAALLYEQFSSINLANIETLPDPYPEHEAREWSARTVAVLPAWAGQGCERQQISILCFNLLIDVEDGDHDALEAIERDQMSLCFDTAARYGGHVAGTLGNTAMVYFGYPHPNDNDARRCAKAALELAGQVRRRTPLLAQQGFHIGIRSAIHSGLMLVRTGYVPAGFAANLALHLVRLADPGNVLASQSAQTILAPYLEFQPAGVTAFPARTSQRYFALTGERSHEFPQLADLGNSATLIGRDAEWAQLVEAWQRARNGDGHAVLLRGDAGIGKSRIVHELAVHVRRHAGSTRHCRCLPEYRNNALQPFLDLLRRELDVAGAPDLAITRLAAMLERAGWRDDSVLPALCSWLALPTPETAPSQLSPERQRQQVFDAVAALLLHGGAAGPTLLMVDDLHWIDHSSLELIGQMLDGLPAHALLLVMTTRPAHTTHWEGKTRTVQLNRLDDIQTAHMIGAMLGRQPIDPAALRYLRHRCDGIPLFIQELTRMLLDSGQLTLRYGVYELDEHAVAANVPITLRDLLGARLARIGRARETAFLAAAIGREFEYELLADVALYDEESVQADLDQLSSVGLIQRLRRVDGDIYQFSHALMRDAAYESLPDALRVQTHARIARRMVESGEHALAGRLAQLARHFALARDYAPAVDHGARAALVALERAAHDDAIALAEGVQEWIRQLPVAAQRGATLTIKRVLTHALMSKYGWADIRVKEQAEMATRLLDQQDDPQSTVPALWAMAFYHHVASNRQAVRGLNAQLQALSDAVHDDGLRVASCTMQGIGDWIDGRYTSAHCAFTNVLRHYDEGRHADHGYVYGLDTRVWAMAALANVRWFTEVDDEAALALARQAIAHARALRHIPSLGVALMYFCFLHHHRGDTAAARDTSAELLALSQHYGLPAVEGYAAILHSWSTGQLEDAERILQGLRRIGCMLGFSYVASLPAEIEARRGNHGAALARIDACLAIGVEIDEPYYRPELLLRRAGYRRHLAPADDTAVRADLLEALALADACGMQRTRLAAHAALHDLAQACTSNTPTTTLELT